MNETLERKPGVSVVIPCLNEEESIAQVIDAAKEGFVNAGVDGEVVVVDNGSTDRSREISAEHGARVLEEKHRGYGSALRKGFANARYDVMIMGDGDMTYDFTKLDDLVKPIIAGEADFVIGNRMRNLKPGTMPWLHQYVGNPILSLMLRFMFHNHTVKDAHCGMRAISADAYKKLRCVTTGMEFASEMVISGIRNNLRIIEKDIVYYPRVGESKLRSFKDGWRHIRFMALHSPTSILLWPGILSWILGMAIVVPLAIGEIKINNRSIDIHTMIVGGLLNVTSMQLIVMGLLAKAYAHLAGLRNDPVVAWFYNKFSFEKAVLCLVPLLLLGVGITLTVVIQWIASGFGALDQGRLLFFGLICLVNSIQLGTSAYVFSIMALPRHFDTLPEHVRDTFVESR